MKMYMSASAMQGGHNLWKHG